MGLLADRTAETCADTPGQSRGDHQRPAVTTRCQFDSLSVLVARGRAKVSAAAAASDWPRRIRDMQHIDVDEHFD